MTDKTPAEKDVDRWFYLLDNHYGSRDDYLEIIHEAEKRGYDLAIDEYKKLMAEQIALINEANSCHDCSPVDLAIQNAIKTLELPQVEQGEGV
jgi:hypothetical protein